MNGTVWPIMYVLDGRSPVPVEEEQKWMDWYQKVVGSRGHILRESEFSGLTITTLFHGLNMTGEEPPLLFATALWRGDPNKPEHSVRYATWEEAEEGHIQIMSELRDNQFKHLTPPKSDALSWGITLALVLAIFVAFFSILR